MNILRGLDKSVELVNVHRQPCSSRHKHSTGVYLLHYMGTLALYSTSIKQFSSLNQCKLWNVLYMFYVMTYNVNIRSVTDHGLRLVISKFLNFYIIIWNIISVYSNSSEWYLNKHVTAVCISPLPLWTMQFLTRVGAYLFHCGTV